MNKQLWVTSYHTAISEIWTFKDHEDAEKAKIMLIGMGDDDTDDEAVWEILEDMIVDSDVINLNLNEQDNYDIINPKRFVYFF